MARARSIKPGFFKNEKLAELSMASRLLFAGLWTLADRDGRMEDRPKRIKAEIFPYEEKISIEKHLNELASAEFIIRYTVDSESYIAIPTWKKHQNPHVKEAASTIPAPCEHSSRTGNSGTSRADSLLPVTDSLNREPDSVNLTPDGGNPASREKRSAGIAADPFQRIADAMNCYTQRPDFGLVDEMMRKCLSKDPEMTTELAELAVHAVVRDGLRIERPVLLCNMVCQLVEDKKHWDFLKSFPANGVTAENMNDAKSYLRDRSVDERTRRFLNAWLASVQSEGAAA